MTDKQKLYGGLPPMTFTLRIPLTGAITSPDDVAFMLERTASHLRHAESFGTACADGYTTQNITIIETGNVVGTFAVKHVEGN